MSLPSDESGFEAILASYLRFYDLDLSRFDGVVTSKAPSYAIRHPNHVCYLQHTMRVFYDMFETEFPQAGHDLIAKRRFIHTLDTNLLATPRLRKRLAIGEEVALRLKQYNGLDAEVLRHPSTLAGMHEGRFEYLFMPGRLHRWKRVDLAIEAMREVKRPVRLLISGDGEDAPRFRKLAEGDDRIEFLGRVDDAGLAELYAGALAVLFVPVREDLGLITFEAFLSGKPVITCRDSGEPSRIVRDGISGFVSPPSAEVLAGRIERLADDPALARRMGAAGRADAREVTWQRVAAGLLSALGFEIGGAKNG